MCIRDRNIIGFVGAPWTLLVYIINQQSPKKKLKDDFGTTYIFVSHDLAVVKYMSDQLIVMNQGKIEEINDADEIYRAPKSRYTKNLIAAIPKGI